MLTYSKIYGITLEIFKIVNKISLSMIRE